jgi:class 3 adenylate cyclase
MIGAALCPVLVGREAELSDLEDVLLGALRGEGGVALVTGEAGMGKTRLTTELRRRATRLGAEVMSGACSEADFALPYLAFIEAIGNRLSGTNLEAIRAQLGAAAEDLGQVFPQLATGGDATVPGDRGESKLRLFEAVISLLQVVAGERGLLLVIDDLHWADPSTRELLDYMTRRIKSGNILVLATARSEELHRRHPLVALIQGWRRAGTVVTVDLRPLPPEGVRDMISATFDGEEVGDEFRDLMVARSEGNPFVIEEMLKAALDRGDIYRTPDGWDRKALRDLTLPATVRDTILARLERLEPRDAEVLRAASVLGQQFGYGPLESLTGAEPSEVQGAIQTGMAQQLLVELEDMPGTYRFRHALTHEAVYTDMLLPRRQRLHSQAADLLKAGGGPSVDIAHHLLAAGRLADAVPVCIEAADEACRAHAPGDAVELYQIALPHLTDPVEHARILCRLGENLGYSGEVAKSRKALEDGLAVFGEVGDPFEVAGYRLMLGRALWEMTMVPQSRRVYESVRDALRDREPSAELALAYLRLSGLHTFAVEAEAARETAELAISIAEAAGADDIRVWAYNFLGLSQIEPGDVDEAMANIDRSYLGAMEQGQVFIAANACYNGLWTAIHLLRMDEAATWLERFKGLSSTIMNTYNRTYLESIYRSLRGELAIAEDLVRKAMVMTRETGQKNMLWRCQVQLANVLMESGRLDEAARTMPPIETRLELQDVTYDGLARGRLLARRGTDEDRRAFIDRLPLLGGAEPVTVHPGPLLSGIELVVKAGDLETAERLMTTAEVKAGSMDIPYVWQMRGVLRMATGDTAGALEALGTAIDGYEARRLPIEAARARVARASAHAQNDDAASAAADLNAAASVAGRLGAGLVREMVAETAVSLGIEPDVDGPAAGAVDPRSLGEKMVSVLFLDVRGYTALTREATPGDITERIAGLQRWAAREVERRGGIVDKFAGDAVMATFNVSGTTVDHALDALRAAIAIRDKAALFELPVGAGIAVGPAVVGTLTRGGNVSVLGNTTNLASRLQAQAGPGEILLSDEVYRRSRVWLAEHPLALEPATLELKGFDDPVAAYRLGARPGGNPTPSPRETVAP